MEKPYRNIVYLFVGILIVSFLGFNKTYFGLFPRFEGTTFVVHFHVFTIMSWFALLIAQPLLIRSKHLALHKKLGQFSYLLVILIVFGFGLIMNQGQLKHKDTGLFAATLFDGVLFILFYGLGIFYRKNTAYHARFMILSALPFINPSIGRLISPAVSLPIELGIILTLLLIERYNQKRYKPYWIGLGSFFIALGFIVYISLINPDVIEFMWQLIWG